MRVARCLRRQQTDAERRLWLRLRSSQVLGVKFRRQHPIGKYIVDFVCMKQRLVVELDGSQHMNQQAADRKRTEFLISRGYQVLRFWDNDVLKNTEAVLCRIAETLTPTPHPTLSP